MAKHYLVGDVGATKTDLALFPAAKGTREYAIKERLGTGEYGSLEKLVASFLKKHRLKIEKAVFAVAGPVLDDRVTPASTILPWGVSRADLVKKLGIPSIVLINDLEAVARAVPLLKHADLHTINRGKKSRKGTLAVIAPGTGLGEAFLVWDGGQYIPCRSEGSQVDFAPRTDFEIELLKRVRKKQGHVSYELICSGLGIPLIYDCLKGKPGLKEPTWLSASLKGAVDRTPPIIDAAMDKERKCSIAQETIKRFVAILGAEAGNLVLKTMATGGIYLAGGISPRIVPYLDSKTFLGAFGDKGIMTEMMPRVPVHIITNPDAAIVGAMCELPRSAQDTGDIFSDIKRIRGR